MAEGDGLVEVRDEAAEEAGGSADGVGGGVVRVIRLSRAEKRNAMTVEMLAELQRAASGDWAGVGAVVVLGDGPTFCAGFDLTACRDDGADQATLGALLSGLSGFVWALRSCPVPVVVGVQGAAIAGGCAVLGGADVVVADRGAKLGYPVVRLGISPAVSGPFLRVGVGDGAARTRLLDPGLIDGERARAIGLVHELVDERGEVGERAVEIGRSMARMPGAGVARTKGWLNEIDGVRAEDVERGLAVSLGLVGGEESRSMLARAWEKE